MQQAEIFYDNVRYCIPAFCQRICSLSTVVFKKASEAKISSIISYTRPYWNIFQASKNSIISYRSLSSNHDSFRADAIYYFQQ